MIPPRQDLVVCFAHAAYQMKACFDALDTGIAQLAEDLATFDPNEDLDGLADAMLAHADSTDDTALVLLRSSLHQ